MTKKVRQFGRYEKSGHNWVNLPGALVSQDCLSVVAIFGQSVSGTGVANTCLKVFAILTRVDASPVKTVNAEPVELVTDITDALDAPEGTGIWFPTIALPSRIKKQPTCHL